MTPQRPSIPEIFKPEDFTNLAPGLEDLAYGKVISRQAQSIFASWLESQKVVFAGGKSLSAWSDKYITGDTHAAYLVCPTPLKRECVEHEPLIVNGTAITATEHGDRHSPYTSITCNKCGAKLRAKWEEAE